MDMDEMAAAFWTAPPAPSPPWPWRKRLRARAEWHFGQGPDYCRGCVALDRDCGLACPLRRPRPRQRRGRRRLGRRHHLRHGDHGRPRHRHAGRTPPPPARWAPTGWAAAELLLPCAWASPPAAPHAARIPGP